VRKTQEGGVELC